MPKQDRAKRINLPLVGGRVGGGGVAVSLSGSGSSGNADTVDGLHASRTRLGGMLYPLDAEGQFPLGALRLQDIAIWTGDGISGGGDLTQSRTLAVDATVVRTTRKVDTGAGLTGGGALSADRTLAVDTGAGFLWTGAHQFQGGLTTRSILPETTDSYDLGSSTRLWRKGWLSELDAVLFAENTISVLGGWLMVAHGQGTFPAEVASAATEVDFGQAMTPGDFVVLRASLAVEYLQVGALVGGTTYAVTRNLDGTGANDWPAGSVYVVLGQLGDGRIELTTANGLPRLSILEQGGSYNAQTERLRLGDLDGSFGVSGHLYGMAMGDYTSGNYLLYNKTDGLVLQAANGGVTIDDSHLRFQLGALGSSQVHWTSGGVNRAWMACFQAPEGLRWNLTGQEPNELLNGSLSITMANAGRPPDSASVALNPHTDRSEVQLAATYGATFGYYYFRHDYALFSKRLQVNSTLSATMIYDTAAVGCYAYRTLQTQCAAGVQTRIRFTHQAWDTDNIWDSAVLPDPHDQGYRLVITHEGYYNIAASCMWEPNSAATLVMLLIKKNNAQFVAVGGGVTMANQSTPCQASVTHLYLAAGDFVEVYGWALATRNIHAANTTNLHHNNVSIARLA